MLLAATSLLYLWNLGASGTENSFYAAAVQAGTKSGKAMFFGSLDAGNAITVDKPALFLWPMEVSGRVFGFNSWSMLVPQALEGAAAVALLHATVRRVAGPAWGLVAGAVLATTPAAVLMFRFDNPDAMLCLLLTAASYATVRALQAGRRGQLLHRQRERHRVRRRRLRRWGLRRWGLRRQSGRWRVGRAGQIASWVAANYIARSVGGQTVYDLRS
jgi:4-amino-4-deoxy-L-arabinose transferase-like glycosyltransferase